MPTARLLLRPRFTLLPALTIAAIAILAGSASFAPQTPAVAPASSLTTAGEQTGDVQLADEIIRRLRRLGFNFNRARLQHPYDPAGDLC